MASTNDLNVQVSAILNQASSLKNINEAIKSLEKSSALRKLSLIVNVESNLTALKDIQSQLDALTGKAKEASDSASKFAENLSSSLNSFSGGIAGLGGEGLFEKLIPKDGLLHSQIESLKNKITTMSGAAGATALKLNLLRLGLIGVRVAAAALEATLSLGLSLAISFVVSGITSLIEKHKQHKEEMEAERQRIEKLAQTWTNHKDTIKQLVKQYQELNTATKHGTTFADSEQAERYQKTMNQIAELLPNLVDHIDEQGNAHLKNVEAIQQELSYTEKLAALTEKVNNEKTVGQKASIFKDDLSKISGNQSEIDSKRKKVESGYADGYAKRSDDKLSAAEIAQLNLDILNLEQSSAEAAANIKNNMADIVESTLELNGIKVDETVTENVQNLLAGFNLEGLNKNEIRTKTTEIANAIKQMYSSDIGAETFSRAATQLQRSLQLTDDQLMAYIDQIQYGTSSTLDLNAESAKIAATFSQTKQELEPLNQAMATMQNGQTLSKQAVDELIKQYPELLSHIQRTADGWTIETSALEDLRKEKLLKAIEDAKNEKLSTDAAIDNAKQRIKAYQLEQQALREGGSSKDQGPVKKKEAPKPGSPDFKLYDPDQVSFNLKNYNETAYTADRAKYLNEEILKEQAEQARREKMAKEQDEHLNFYYNQLDSMETGSGGSGGGGSGGSGASDPKPVLDDAIMSLDITKEEVKELNALFDARNKNIEALDRQIKAAEKAQDYGKTLDFTTKKLEAQKNAVAALEAAQVTLNKKATNLRANNSKFDTSDWFDADGEASVGFKRDLNEFATKSQAVHEDKKLTVEQKNTAIEALEEQQQAAQNLFDQLYAVKQGWSANAAEILNFKSSIEETQEALSKLKLENTNTYLDKQRKGFEALDDQFDAGQKTLQLYEKGTAAYNAQQEKQNTLLQSKVNFVQSEFDWAEKRLKQGGLEEGQIAAVNEYLTEQKAKLLDLQVAQKQAADSWAADVKKAAEDALSVVEEHYKRQGEAAVKALEKEMDAYKEIIGLQKQAFNRENKTEDFESSRDKLQKEAQELQNRLNKYSLDSSIEGKAKQAEIRKQLADKNEEIAELEQDRSRTLREENFDDLLANKEKEINAAKEAADQKWQTELAQDSQYRALKEAILNNSITNMESALQGFSANAQTYMNAIGSSIDINIAQKLDEIQKVKAVLNGINMLGTNPSTTFAANDMNAVASGTGASAKQTDYERYLKLKHEAEQIGTSKAIKDGSYYQSLTQEAEALRKRWGFANLSYDEAKNITYFHDGGEVGEPKTTQISWVQKALKSDEVMGILRNSEVVLNKPIQFINDIANRIIGSLSPAISTVSVPVAGNTNFSFTISGNTFEGGEAGAQSFMDLIERKIRTKQR
ncbi:hypothetical protein [Cohnella hashimotonis]|uniref:Phage tail tape measure protein n=1 Tax=Cohnella hashimotonis TaxID=2826895 RepID=A0ABT6TL23_9BACL|nr:hypothetical protein [Cohnella hashimotonis]MDI4647414.1 hypothetical protein [Cohnella hashimotonis]